VKRVNVMYLSAAVWCLACAGCFINGTVTDLSHNKTELKGVKLLPKRRNITILHGDATRLVRLKDVDKITVYPSATKTVGGQLYYQAEVILDDGTKIGFSGRSEPGDAYICVDGSLQGRAEGGKYSITLDNVSEIEIRN